MFVLASVGVDVFAIVSFDSEVQSNRRGAVCIEMEARWKHDSGRI